MGLVGWIHITEDNCYQSGTYRIFPNPTTGLLQITRTREGVLQNTQVKIYNRFGQMVQNAIISGSAHAELSLDNIPAGMYIIQIQGKDGIPESLKVIKQ